MVGIRFRHFSMCAAIVGALAANVALVEGVMAQNSGVSAWDAADFRIWGYVPNWTTVPQINNFNTNGIYNHVSDILYFGGVQPRSNGTLHYYYGNATQNATNHIAALKTASQSHGFNLHLSPHLNYVYRFERSTRR
jgi:hypothetical protein